MKSISVIIACLVTLVLVSCGPNKPDNKNYGVVTEFSHYEPAGAGNQPKAVYDSSVLIKPTWGQANAFAHHRKGAFGLSLLGFLFLAVFAAIFYGRASNAKWYPDVDDRLFYAALFISLALSITAFKGVSSFIMWNNDKLVPKAQYDNAIKTTGSTQVIWDSLENGCHIVGGKFDCFNK